MTTTYYKTATPKSNLVVNPPSLPKQFEVGSINITKGLEQPPSGSIAIEGIPLLEIEDYRNTYNQLNTRIDIYDIPFVIKGYAEVVNRVSTYDGLGAEVFNITVQLNSWWEYLGSLPVKVNENISSLSARVRRISVSSLSSKAGVPYIGPYLEIEIPAGADKLYTTTLIAELSKYSRLKGCYLNYNNKAGIELKVLNEGVLWELDDEDILYTLQSNVTTAPSFIEADLGEFDTDPSLRDRTLLETAQQYVIEPPVITTVTEGEDASVEPIFLGGTLRDVSSAADRTGPRKSSKTTTLINGNPLTETVKTYSYIYTAKDIIKDNADEYVPMQKSSSGYWKLLDTYTTQYIYKEAYPETFQVKVKDRTGRLVTAYFLDDSTLNGFNEGAKFLVGSTTQGYKKTRFLRETELDTREYQAELDQAIADGSTVDIAYYSALLSANEWRTVPYISQESMKLAYYSEYYNLTKELPYSIDKVFPSDISNTVNVSSFDKDIDGYIYLIRLNPNYTPGLFVLSSKSYSNSFLSIPNPENILIKDELDNGGIEPQYVVFKPSLTTGEESESSMLRSIYVDEPKSIPGLNGSLTDRSYYTEYNKKYLAGDGEFNTGAMETSFKEIPGKPPSASSYRINYIPLNDLSQYRDTIKVYVTSDLTHAGTPTSGESFNFPTLYIQDALEALKNELRMRHWVNAYRETINIAFNYQLINPGDYIDFFSNDEVLAAKRAVDVNFTLNYKGTLNDGTRLITCDGTQVTVGEYREREVASYRTVTVKNRPDFDTQVNISIPFRQISGPAIGSVGVSRRS